MNGLLILNAVMPFVMVLVGGILKRHPVSDMYSQNGYSTPVSRKSQIHWDYAQSIAPDIFITIGKWLFVIEAVISIALLLLRISAGISVIVGTGVGVLALFGGFLYTDSRIEEFVSGRDIDEIS